MCKRVKRCKTRAETTSRHWLIKKQPRYHDQVKVSGSWYRSSSLNLGKLIQDSRMWCWIEVQPNRHIEIGWHTTFHYCLIFKYNSGEKMNSCLAYAIQSTDGWVYPHYDPNNRLIHFLPHSWCWSPYCDVCIVYKNLEINMPVYNDDSIKWEW